MIGLDTNVLVRFLTRDDEAQARLAGDLIRSRCSVEHPGFISRVVQCELVWVLESAYDYSREQIASTLDRIFRTRQFLIEDAPVAMLALRAYRQDGVDYADALIGFGNRRTGCDETATFDRRAAKLAVFQRLD